MCLTGCPEILAMMNKKRIALEEVCNVSVSSGPDMQQPQPYFYNWTSVPITTIGYPNARYASTVSFTIPSVIPSSAREVLIYVRIYSGHNNRNGPLHDIKVFTEIGTTRYEKYMFIYTYIQSASSVNSDNMWFPMPPNRRVYVTIDSVHGNNVGVRLAAIGYR